MAIVRLADTPIIVPDDYVELRALYPNAKSGPILRLAVAVLNRTGPTRTSASNRRSRVRRALFLF